MKRAMVVALSAATFLGVGMANAPFAMAHDAYTDISPCGAANGRCGYGGITNNHTRAYACDTYPDGFGVVTYYFFKGAAGGFVVDPNGSDSGCGSATPGSASKPISSWMFCIKSTPNYRCTPELTA